MVFNFVAPSVASQVRVSLFASLFFLFIFFFFFVLYFTQPIPTTFHFWRSDFDSGCGSCFAC